VKLLVRQQLAVLLRVLPFLLEAGRQGLFQKYNQVLMSPSAVVHLYISVGNSNVEPIIYTSYATI
jgi:hypothetical protein